MSEQTKATGCWPPALTEEETRAELKRLGFNSIEEAQAPTPLELQIEKEMGRLPESE